MIFIEALLVLFTLGLAVAAIALMGLGLFERWFRRGRRAVGKMTAAILALTAVIFIVDITIAANLRRRGVSPALHVQLIERSGLWEARYPGGVATTELHVPAGNPVTIESLGQPHLLFLPGTALLGMGRRCHRGEWLMEVERTGFVRAVSFIVRRHAMVPLPVVAESRNDFDRWLAHQSEKASPPIDASVAHGRQTFFTARCAYCHVIRGVWEVAEEPAPDLTHLVSRAMIAGRVPNRRGYLAGWIVDPKSVDPNTTMPPNAIDPRALSDLLTFLETLK